MTTKPLDEEDPIIGDVWWPYFRLVKIFGVPYHVILAFEDRIERFGNPLSGYRTADDMTYANGGLFQAIERAQRRERTRRRMCRS